MSINIHKEVFLLKSAGVFQRASLILWITVVAPGNLMYIMNNSCVNMFLSPLQEVFRVRVCVCAFFQIKTSETPHC